MDDQPRVDLARDDRGEDLVVAKLDDIAESGCREPEEKERRRLATRHGDPPGGRLLERHRLARNDERADPATERGAAPQQPVAIAGGRSSAEAQLRQLELATRRAPVQLLDVVEHRVDLERRVDEPVRERVERERVVRARREAEALHERPESRLERLEELVAGDGRTRSPWPSRSETVKSSSSVSFAS